MNIETRLGAKNSAKEMAVHEENINWFYNKIKGLREKMHLGKEILSRVFKKETLKMMVIETQP